MRQADLQKNGLVDFYRVLGAMDEFDFVEFQKDDIVRSQLVKNYIIKKEEILNKV
jgi:phosphate starvation-inducible protein PhoH